MDLVGGYVTATELVSHSIDRAPFEAGRLPAVLIRL
jgi:hypothetical protein